MANLPVPKTPIYSQTLPSNGKSIKFRPWNGLEEKSIQVALSDNDKTTLHNTIMSVIYECTFGELDVENLPDVDIDWMIAHLRSKSVGEIVELQTKCTKCEKQYDFDVDVSKVTIVDPLEGKRDFKIKVDDDIYFKMKYPSKASVTNYTQNNGTLDAFIASMIELVYTEEEVFNAKDLEQGELELYVKKFRQAELAEVLKFVDNIPKVTTKTEVKCTHCKTPHNVTLEGVDFFLN
jgi:ribosomal protein L44E